MTSNEQYVVAALGARDYYQVAIALNHVGKLSALVTDFYTPDFFRKIVKKRFSLELSSEKTVSFLAVAVLALLVRGRLFFRFRRQVDKLFGSMAARQCKERGSSAIVYSYYIEGFVGYCKRVGWRPKHLVLFQVHPSPWHINEILANDAVKAKELLGICFEPDIEATYSAQDYSDYLSAVDFCDHVICASSFTAKSIGLNPSDQNVTIAPYGSKFEVAHDHVDKEYISFSSLDKTRLVSVTQVVQRKGLHWAFAALAADDLADKVEWIIISSRIDPKIREIAPKCVTFIDRVPDAHMLKILQDAEMFVLPSLVEGFGLVLIEALSVGLPVMYTANTGIADLENRHLFGYELDLIDLSGSFTTALQEFRASTDSKEERRASAVQGASKVTWENFQRIVVSAID